MENVYSINELYVEDLLRQIYNSTRQYFSKIFKEHTKNKEEKLEKTVSGYNFPVFRRRYWDPQEWKWSYDSNIANKKPRRIHWNRDIKRFERKN